MIKLWKLCSTRNKNEDSFSDCPWYCHQFYLETEDLIFHFSWKLWPWEQGKKGNVSLWTWDIHSSLYALMLRTLSPFHWTTGHILQAVIYCLPSFMSTLYFSHSRRCQKPVIPQTSLSSIQDMTLFTEPLTPNERHNTEPDYRLFYW